MEWKNNNEGALVLTFDVDGRHMWSAREKMGDSAFGKLGHISSGDFGINVGVDRILSVLDNFGLTGGFFIPGLVAEEDKKSIGKIVNHGHEIYNHGYQHLKMSDLDKYSIGQSINDTGTILAQLKGNNFVTGFRAPFGDVSLKMIDVLINQQFDFDSSLRHYDTPYILKTEEGSIFEIPMHWTGVDSVFFNYSAPEGIGRGGISPPSDVYDIWVEELNEVEELGLLMVLICHPQIIGSPDKLRMFRKFLKLASDQQIWITSPRKLINYCRERKVKLPTVNLS